MQMATPEARDRLQDFLAGHTFNIYEEVRMVDVHGPGLGVTGARPSRNANRGQGNGQGAGN